VAKAKKSFVRFITPKGVAVYPKLNKPDEYKGKVFYSCKLRMDREIPAVAEFLKLVDEQHQAGLAKQKAEFEQAASEEKDAKKRRKISDALAALTLGPSPVKAVTLEDGTDSPNLVEVNFKMPATTKRDGIEMAQRPDLYDGATGKIKLVPEKTPIWGGSELKVGGFFFPYYAAATNGAGVSLRMTAVQVIKLVSGGSNRDPGFGAEEGGYGAEEESNPFDGDSTAPATAGDEPKSGVSF
jgi:hypothetical protein